MGTESGCWMSWVSCKPKHTKKGQIKSRAETQNEKPHKKREGLAQKHKTNIAYGKNQFRGNDKRYLRIFLIYI